MSARLMIPGVEYDFGGGRVYTIPPLSLGALQLMQDRLAALPTLNSIDPVAVRTMIESAYLALRRNYPDITTDEVAELVDLGNVGEVYECLLDAAGVKRKAQAAERAQGNAAAKSLSAGTDSSPVSVPTPDGIGSMSAPM
jgi:hypothetical protein